MKGRITMTLEEFNTLEKKDDLLSVNDLENQEDRTLLYGYTMNFIGLYITIKRI